MAEAVFAGKWVEEKVRRLQDAIRYLTARIDDLDDRLSNVEALLAPALPAEEYITPTIEEYAREYRYEYARATASHHSSNPRMLIQPIGGEHLEYARLFSELYGKELTPSDRRIVKAYENYLKSKGYLTYRQLETLARIAKKYGIERPPEFWLPPQMLGIFEAEHSSSPELPPRGYGLTVGRAGKRRLGKPRTEVERAIRHRLAEMTREEFEKHRPEVIAQLTAEGYPPSLVEEAIGEITGERSSVEICRVCGAEIPEGWEFCPVCLTPVKVKIY